MELIVQGSAFYVTITPVDSKRYINVICLEVLTLQSLYHSNRTEAALTETDKQCVIFKISFLISVSDFERLFLITAA
jgi:predicted  nucleic acid-binding Zn ribbon protein